MPSIQIFEVTSLLRTHRFFDPLEAKIGTRRKY